MWRLTEKEMEGVLSLPGSARYSHFIKKVADTEVICSLWDDGWALADDEKGQSHVPVWPHAKYAELCATGVWQKYQPRAIPIGEWLSAWLPGIQKDRRLVAVFPTPKERGISVQPARMAFDLREELAKYE